MTLHADHPAEGLDQSIGERAYMLMFRQKVRQNELGQVLHLNQSGVARRLRGETSWRSTDLVAAAALLDTTVAYLVGEVDDDPNSRPLD